MGVGPYPTKHSAQKATDALLGAVEGSGYVVVPVTTDQGLKSLLSDLDAKPSLSGDFAEVRRDAIAFKRGWRGGKDNPREKYLGEAG